MYGEDALCSFAPHQHAPGFCFGLISDQPPQFKNKNQSEKGQIKTFTSCVCIKQGKQSLLQPCEAFLYLEWSLRLSLAEETAEFSYHLVSITGGRRGQRYTLVLLLPIVPTSCVTVTTHQPLLDLISQFIFKKPVVSAQTGKIK